MSTALRTPRVPRAFRPSEVKRTRRAEHVATAIMDATGRPQLELGDVVLLDPRTAKALRFALDAALHEIAERFHIKYHLDGSAADGVSSSYNVCLSVKTTSRAMPARS